MLAYANISKHHTVLVPNAGSGELAYAVADQCDTVYCTVDQNEKHAQGLRGSGRFICVINSMFLGELVNPIFDRVVVFPPFGFDQARFYFLRAFEWVKPGGVLVAAVETTIKQGADNTHKAVINTIETYGGAFIDLPPSPSIFFPISLAVLTKQQSSST